jgi:hypothetical protein
MIARILTELRHGRLPGRALIRVGIMLWIVRLAMWCMPFASLRARLSARRDALARRRPASRRGDLARIARHVRLGSRLVPRCTCLVQALVAEQLLAESGHASVVRFGMADAADQRSSAHAWVECEGRVLVGGDVSGYVAFRSPEPHLPR